MGWWLLIANKIVKAQHFPNVNLLGKRLENNVGKKSVLDKSRKGTRSLDNDREGCPVNEADVKFFLADWPAFFLPVMLSSTL